MDNPIITIVTAHRNTPDWIELFVKSIRRFTTDIAYEIIIIDNDSLEVNKKWIKDQRDINLIELPTGDLHHGGAMDLGTKTAKSRHVCILDSDAHVQRPGWAQDLIALYHENDRTRLIGCVGPVEKPLHPPLWFFERDFILEHNISWRYQPSPAVPTQTDTAQQAYWDILALGYEVVRLNKGTRIYQCAAYHEEIWIGGKPTIAHFWWGTRFQENNPAQTKLMLDGKTLDEHLKRKSLFFSEPLIKEILEKG